MYQYAIEHKICGNLLSEFKKVRVPNTICAFAARGGRFNVTKKEYGGGPGPAGDLLSNTVWYRVPNAPNSKRMVLNPGPPAPDHLR